MKVSDAVLARRSIRAFTSEPINNKVIKDLLALAARSPSGGNLQPWKIYVVNKQSMKKFIEFQDNWDQPETPGYAIYPSGLTEPYRTSRYQLGEAMYELLGIPREDKDARLQQVMRNFKFFGAPAALFCFVDKQMGPPQWSDLGMFLQTFMRTGSLGNEKRKCERVCWLWRKRYSFLRSRFGLQG
jgi:nitroreductase